MSEEVTGKNPSLLDTRSRNARQETYSMKIQAQKERLQVKVIYNYLKYLVETLLELLGFRILDLMVKGIPRLSCSSNI